MGDGASGLQAGQRSNSFSFFYCSFCDGLRNSELASRSFIFHLATM